MHSPTPPPSPGPLPFGSGSPPDGALVPYGGYSAVPGYPLAPSSAAAPPSMLRRYLACLGRKWWIVVLCVLLFAAAAAAYVVWWPPNYVATAHMWIAGRMGLSVSQASIVGEDNLTFAGTQIELLQSGMMLGRAFDRVRARNVSFPTNSEGKPIIPSIKVTQLPKSSVLRLTCKARTEELAVAFLNAAMEEFLAYKKQVRASTSMGTYTSVSDQIKKQEDDLKMQQEKLNEYAVTNNVAVLEETAKAASQFLTQLLATLDELKLQHQLLLKLGENPGALAAMTNAFPGSPDPRQLVLNPMMPFVTPPPEFLAAKQELEKVRIRKAQLSKYLRPAHPKIVRLDELMAQDEKLVEYHSTQSRDMLQETRKTLQLRIDQTQALIKEWEGKVNDASQRLADYERLKLSVNRLQELHVSLLILLQSVDITRNLDQENITVLDRPSQAAQARDKLIATVLLLLAGLGTGLGLVFLVEQSDDRIRSLEGLSSQFEEWVVGQIPDIPKARKKNRLAMLEANDPRHAYAESFRSIRSALWFTADHQEKPKTLLVTSAVPGEGKSTLAANLARTIAAAGARVLLIDADLRRGLLHELFEVPAEPGLSDLLAQGGDLPFYLAPTSAPNLMLLPRGKAENNSGALFLSSTCDQLLARARNEFDCVIVDSIPVFAADDTTSLAPKLDGVLFVVRDSFTSADVARHALQLLYERQAKVLGLVLNRTNPQARAYKYYKYAEYYRRP